MFKVFVESILDSKNSYARGSSMSFELEKIPSTDEEFLDLILSNVDGMYGFFPGQKNVTFILHNAEVRDEQGHYEVLASLTI